MFAAMVVGTTSLIANVTVVSPSTTEESVAVDVLSQGLFAVVTMAAATAAMTSSDDNADAALDGAVGRDFAISCYSTGTSWWAEKVISDE